MQLKRYRSYSVRDALAEARRELGPQALVLSTRMVPARGPRGWLGARVVEVTAAANPNARNVSENRPAAAPETPVQVAEASDSPLPRPVLPVVARLCAAGLDRALATDAVARLPRFRRRNPSLSTLRHVVGEALARVASGLDDLAPVEVFVGPPGAGKTTTIAKIAAQERVKRNARVVLVAADGFRVGAVEQLRLYADILGSPFHVVRSPEELDRILEDVPGPMLVDTAGRSPRDLEATRLFEIFAGRPGVRTHLVVPASSTPLELAIAAERFADARPARVVLTKVDEASSVAPAVSWVRDHSLRVSFLGTGQRVPEDLVRATAPALAAHVLGDDEGLAGSREC